MRNLIERLKKKGWGKKDISKAVDIIRNAKQNKPQEIRFLEKHIYWTLLILIVVANFAVSVASIPILMAMKGMLLYAVILLLGIIFGLLFELLIRSMEHLEKKHHIFLAILIPLIALVNVFVITNISNSVIRNLNLANTHNSMIIGIVYAVSFVLPYLISRFVLKIGYYARG
ncbi:MAG: hypothetical protein AABX33_06250 [Nanoarchaeota archaeon]